MEPDRERDGWLPCSPGEVRRLRARLRGNRRRKVAVRVAAGGAIAALLLVILGPWIGGGPKVGPDGLRPGGLWCAEVVAMAEPYRSGELPPESREAVRDHVSQCPECGPMFERLGIPMASVGWAGTALIGSAMVLVWIGPMGRRRAGRSLPSAIEPAIVDPERESFCLGCWWDGNGPRPVWPEPSIREQRMKTDAIDPTREPARNRSVVTFLQAAGLLAVIAVCAASVAARFGGVWPSASPNGEFSGMGAASDPFEVLNFEDLAIPKEQILSGGPGVDGIPSLTNPEHLPVDAGPATDDEMRIIGVTVGDESRAYPINLLNWHEVINDRLGGREIAVVYCPLCDSASVVDRTLDGSTFEFGVSGLLTNSNVLLYDRTDKALWSQIGFEAISGPNVGRSLEHLTGWEIAPFGDWRERHPDSSIVSFATGHLRNYATNPYAGYFEQPDPIPQFSRIIPKDDRLPSKERVIGVKVGDSARAYPLTEIARSDEGTLRDRLGDGEVVLTVDPDTGAVRVVDLPEGGQAVHTFWYSWAGFHPESDRFEAPTAPLEPSR